MMKVEYIIPWMCIVVMLSLSGCNIAEVVGGKIPSKDLIDGVYQGTATGGPVKVIAEVTIQDQKVTQIKILKHRTGRGRPAEKVIPERIIRQQSTSVDALTGATISSSVIMNAVENAVRKGMKQATAP